MTLLTAWYIWLKWTGRTNWASGKWQLERDSHVYYLNCSVYHSTSLAGILVHTCGHNSHGHHSCSVPLYSMLSTALRMGLRLCPLVAYRQSSRTYRQPVCTTQATRPTLSLYSASLTGRKWIGCRWLFWLQRAPLLYFCSMRVHHPILELEYRWRNNGRIHE